MRSLSPLFRPRFLVTVLVVVALIALGGVLTASAGTGAALKMIPTSHNYGSVVAGSPGPTFSFTVQNVGTVQDSGPIAITITGANASQFVLQGGTCPVGGTVAHGSSCTVLVQFAPLSSASGLQKATLKVTGVPGGTAQAALSGTSLNAHLTLSPATWNFGETKVGDTSTVKTFTVRNDGTNSSGPVSLALTGGSPSQFSIAGTGSCVSGVTVLAPGDTCTIDTKFNPTSTGNKNTKLQASASPGGTVQSALSGTGTLAKLTISPGSYNFGNSPVGTETPASAPFVVFTVTNTGTAASGNLGPVTLVGTNPGDFKVESEDCQSVSLAPGDTCTIHAAFQPTAFGNRSAKLQVDDTQGVIGQASLTGKGVGSQLKVTPATWDFGSVNFPHGDSSGLKTFTLKNIGTAPTGAVPSVITGGDASDFPGGPGGNCDTAFPLAAGASCTFTAYFSPTAAGARQATFQISTTPSDGTTLTLTGTGTQATLVISDPASNPFDFGSVYYGGGESSSPQTFTVTNIGDGTSGAVSAVITGSSDFAIDNDFCAGTATLAPGATCTFDVTYTPSAGGAAPTSSVDVSTPFSFFEGNPSTDLDGFGSSAAMSWTPGSNDFGPVQENTASTEQTFTLKNVGGHDTDVSSVELTGTDPDQFQITDDDCTGQTLQASQANSCDVKVRFIPDSTGTKDAFLRAIPSGVNDTIGAASLTGEGTT